MISNGHQIDKVRKNGKDIGLIMNQNSPVFEGGTEPIYPDIRLEYITARPKGTDYYYNDDPDYELYQDGIFQNKTYYLRIVKRNSNGQIIENGLIEFWIPILHWNNDSSTYEPCFYDKVNNEYRSANIDEPEYVVTRDKLLDYIGNGPYFGEERDVYFTVGPNYSKFGYEIKYSCSNDSEDDYHKCLFGGEWSDKDSIIAIAINDSSIHTIAKFNNSNNSNYKDEFLSIWRYFQYNNLEYVYYNDAGGMRLYYQNIIDGSSNTKICLIPVLHNGVACLYNITGNQYIYNSGTYQKLNYKILGYPVISEKYIEFDDPIFEAYCLEHFDYYQDNKISVSEVKNVKNLIISGLGIKSLKGIEYFTSLETLLCHNNQLSNLDITNNTKLSYLICDNNNLTEIDVSKNVNLVLLACNENQLRNLNVNNNILLSSLMCHGNQLVNINLSNNPLLKILDLQVNQLTSLDVSNNSELTELALSTNNITNINLTNNTKLIDFSCSSNQLTSLDLSNNTVLQWFMCVNNPHLSEIWLKSGQTIENFYYDSSVATVYYKD